MRRIPTKLYYFKYHETNSNMKGTFFGIFGTGRRYFKKAIIDERYYVLDFEKGRQVISRQNGKNLAVWLRHASFHGKKSTWVSKNCFIYCQGEKNTRKDSWPAINFL